MDHQHTWNLDYLINKDSPANIIIIIRETLKSPLSFSDLHKIPINKNFLLTSLIFFSYFGLFNAQDGIVLMPKKGIILRLKIMSF
jgi:hypothetical protein